MKSIVVTAAVRNTNRDKHTYLRHKYYTIVIMEKLNTANKKLKTAHESNERDYNTQIYELNAL